MRVFFVSFLLLTASVCTFAQTILIGPKTIGRGWKDNIVLEARHFQNCKAGDVLTVYTDNAKSNAQGAFQNPEDWQAIADEYKYFAVDGPFRLTITDQLLPLLQQNGLGIGGHDYRITYATLTPAEAFSEKIVWRGPSVQMKSDWSQNAYIPSSAVKDLKVGDALKFHISKAEPDACIKVSDFTWNPISKTADGAGVSGSEFVYYIDDNEPIIKIQLAGTSNDRALIVGGKGYRLDKIGVLSIDNIAADTEYEAQHAPAEYVLQLDELFHGEKKFNTDWRDNLRVTAEKLQEATENDVLIISYKLLPEATNPVMSIRENRGNWQDISGTSEPQWQPLDGTDYVLTFDEASLDKVKTKGFVVTGQGFVLNRIQIISAE